PVSTFGAARDASSDVMSDRAIYCAAINVDWAVPNEILSGKLRVYWPTSTAPRSLLDRCFDGGGALDIEDLDLNNPGTRTRAIQQVNSLTIPITLRSIHIP